jgi:hypothetical protein
MINRAADKWPLDGRAGDMQFDPSPDRDFKKF